MGNVTRNVHAVLTQPSCTSGSGMARAQTRKFNTAGTQHPIVLQVVEKLGLLFSTAEQLNKIIDGRLSSGCPRFTRREIKVGGEAFDIYYHTIITHIHALFSDPEFSGILVFAPECQYAHEDCWNLRAKGG
ncbi:hypothetical protein NUW54_g14158 [Trametes sanguinea]|uniref:Uncharacterized protein n=1 Tax=Trametes sanguinea TaxID=158606 RepID=A0ACC1MF67_9APHY|nr:hypothetical protein NUW54_g14158 [Trametes sanguinea]